MGCSDSDKSSSKCHSRKLGSIRKRGMPTCEDLGDNRIHIVIATVLIYRPRATPQLLQHEHGCSPT